MATSYENKCAILSELWLNYRDDEDFVDFVEYNDLGLPLAYALDAKIVESTPMAQGYIEETFDLLLAGLEIEEDTGFESIDELLEDES
jgi:hypothetical protein